MRIVVTQGDIAKGVRKREKCPIALSLNRRGFDDVYVLSNWVGFGEFQLWLPETAVRFIAYFDSGQPVKPEGFNLEVPS